MTGARKHTVAGTIPVEWDAKLIKNCCDVVRGASPRPAGDPKYFDGDYLPWITVADVTGVPGMYLNGTRTKLTKEGANFTRLIPPATLIITNSGATLGVPKITRELSGANDGIAVFLNLKDISKECLFYILESQTEYFRNELAPGVGQPNLNTELLGDVAIPIPLPSEQDRIVGALSTWDTAIQKTEQLIAAKEWHFAATSHLLLTSRKRLNGFWMKWEQRRADEIFENTSRKGHLNEPLLSVTQERGVIPRDMLEGRVTMPSGETGAFKLVEPSNFVISLRSFQGGLEHSNYRGLVSPAYTVLKELVEIDDRFFRHYFKSADFIKRLSVAVIGIRDGKQISFQDFCSIKLPFPAVDEQKAIAAFLDEAEGEITLLRKYAVALKTQKRGLMQKLLTGQWRLPVQEEAN